MKPILAALALFAAVVALRLRRDARRWAEFLDGDDDTDWYSEFVPMAAWGGWNTPPNCDLVCSLRGTSHRHSPRASQTTWRPN